MSPTEATVAPDPSHFARVATDFGDRQSVVAGAAIYNAQGVKLIEKGVRVDSRLYERLTQHKLSAPLAESLRAERTLNGARLREAAVAALLADPQVAELLAQAPARQALLDEVALVPLPGPVAFQLSALEATRPDAWQYALRSMLVAGWLAGLRAGHSRHDVRMLACGGLLCDLGMLHVDPVLQRPQAELGSDQRRHLYAHPLVTVMMLERHHEYPRELLRAVLEHHECLDGSGYPRGTSHEGMSPWGRVLGLTKLVSTLLAPGMPQALQRLSVALRMNRHRYDPELSQMVQRALPATPAVPLPGADDPLRTLGEIGRLLAAWPQQPPPGLTPERTEATRVIQQQCAQLQRVLASTGVGVAAIGMLENDRLDDAAQTELTLIAREAAWQLRVLARQSRRRIRDSEGPLPEWLLGWLGEADALCARWLSEPAQA